MVTDHFRVLVERSIEFGYVYVLYGQLLLNWWHIRIDICICHQYMPCWFTISLYWSNTKVIVTERICCQSSQYDLELYTRLAVTL